MRRFALPLVAAVVLTVLGSLAGPAGLVTPDEVLGADTDLTLVTNSTYTVHPDEGRVGVSVGITARNRTSETRTRRFWFDHAFLAVQPGARSPRISGHKGARVRVVNSNARATMLRIDFGQRLYSGKTAALRLTFDLLGHGRKAAPQTRVGDSLVTIPVWAFASDGARGSSVTVRFPEDWDVAVESGTLKKSSGDGGTVLTSGAIDAPLKFFAYVTAQQPASYVEREVAIPVGEATAQVVLQGWADDPNWATRVHRQLEAALPVLAEDIGLPWPLEEPLVVREAASRDADAVAGRYDPATNTLEVAYWADPAVLVRQVAHAWFNGDLLTERWANEGFASWYAQRAADTLGLAMTPPTATDEALAGVGPLGAWAGPDPAGDELVTDADAAAAAASHALVAELAEQAGPETLAATWADIADGTGAWQPPAGTPAADTVESVVGPADWRRLLDLLEVNAGSRFDDVWRERIVTEEQAAELDARADARLSYEQTLAIAGAWQLPRAARDALRGWQFETAEAILADSRTVLAQRNAVAGLADRDGLQLPDAMRGLFEEGLLAEASAKAEAERAAILSIEEARDARSADDDLLSRIGMLGEHPDAELAAARTSLAQGDLDATVASADRAHRAWTVAWQEGRRRALLALAVLATLIVLVSAVVAQVRRARRPGGGATSATGPRQAHAAPSATASSSTGAGSASNATGDDVAPA
jgi:hypothetical protein